MQPITSIQNFDEDDYKIWKLFSVLQLLEKYVEVIRNRPKLFQDKYYRFLELYLAYIKEIKEKNLDNNNKKYSFQDKARIFYHMVQILKENLEEPDDTINTPVMVSYRNDSTHLYCKALNFISEIAQSLTPKSAITKWIRDIKGKRDEISYISLDSIKQSLIIPKFIFRYSSTKRDTVIYNSITELVAFNESRLFHESMNSISFIIHEDRTEQFILPIVFALLNSYYPQLLCGNSLFNELKDPTLIEYLMCK